MIKIDVTTQMIIITKVVILLLKAKRTIDLTIISIELSKPKVMIINMGPIALMHSPCFGRLLVEKRCAQAQT